MKKIDYLIAITISVLVISLSIIFIVSDKEVFSENEFRYLEKFPKFNIERFVSGTYTKGLENYTTDHFPMRISLMKLKTEAKILTMHNLINNVYIAKDNYLINNFEKPQNEDKIINILNTFVKNNDTSSYTFMLIPTSSSINADLLPKNNINAKEKEVIDYYYNHLNMQTIDVYDTFMKEKNNYDLYYKTDHHWTSFGAYIAYREFAIVKNIPYYDISTLEVKKVSSNFLGTLYSKVFTIRQEKDDIYYINTKDNDFTATYTNYKINSLYQDKYLKEKDKYSYFLGNNDALVKIKNNKIKENSELLIIKDSYANSLIPLLANHYKIIHVIDPRYYGTSISDYIKENNIEDILFIYNVNSIDEDTGILNLK